MIADLYGEDLSGPNCLQLPRKMVSTFLNLRKCAGDSSLRVKDSRALAIFFARTFPRLENRVA